MKRISVLVPAALMAVLFLFASCTNENAKFRCDHCHELTKTSDRIVDGIDMQVCDDCYDAYLQGSWGMKSPQTAKSEGQKERLA